MLDDPEVSVVVVGVMTLGNQEFLDLLELMGADDPRTATYRKALSRQLF